MTDCGEVSRGYANALSMMAMLAVPVAAGLAALAPYFVSTVLGVKWLAAVPLMQILAFNGALLMFHSPVCSVLLARGYPQMPVIANGLYVVLLFSLLSIVALSGEKLGVRGVALAALLSSLLSTPIYLYMMQRKLSISPIVFFRAIARPAGASALMTLVLVSVLPGYDRSMPDMVVAGWLLIGVGVGAVVYVLALLALWVLAKSPEGPERLVLEQATKVIGNLKASFSTMRR